MRKQLTQKDYTQNNISYQLVLPLNIEFLIPKDDPVRLLSQIMEELDYSELKKGYSSKGRNPVVSPKTLCQVLVYAYMNNIYTSRMIEKACRRDLNFMWLLQGQKAPDHNTISRFRTERIQGFVNGLLNQIVVNLSELGEVKFDNVFVDGTKIEANANKYSFVWKKAVSKNELKLKENIKSFVQLINKEFQFNYIVSDDINILTLLKDISDNLLQLKSELNIEFVHGIGKRKTCLQKAYEKAEDFLLRQSKYNEYNKTFNGRNSFSKTDKDATFMHMKEDHMRNSQLKPGYNVQIGVESEYIVGVDISSERSDQLTLIPFLEKLDKSLPQRFKNVVADAGYESEENYVYLNEQNQNAYIKPQIYEGMQKNRFKRDISKRENMLYDEINDQYICHNGKTLKNIGWRTRKSASGYKAEVTIYECESCEGCQFKEKCSKATGNRKLNVSKTFLKMREESLKNITTPQGILLRMNRSIQVEGAFGVLKEDYGFRKFLTRGKKNVETEFILLSIGYNINKLHSKIQNGKCGQSLYQKEIA